MYQQAPISGASWLVSYLVILNAREYLFLIEVRTLPVAKQGPSTTGLINSRTDSLDQTFRSSGKQTLQEKESEKVSTATHAPLPPIRGSEKRRY